MSDLQQAKHQSLDLRNDPEICSGTFMLCCSEVRTTRHRTAPARRGRRKEEEEEGGRRGKEEGGGRRTTTTSNKLGGALTPGR